MAEEPPEARKDRPQEGRAEAEPAASHEREERKPATGAEAGEPPAEKARSKPVKSRAKPAPRRASRSTTAASTRREASARRARSGDAPDEEHTSHTDGDTSTQDTLAPPTEKPVAAQRSSSQYVVTVDDAGGQIIKIEKLDVETNERAELTREEYMAAYSHASLCAPYYANYAAALYDPMRDPAAQAYLKAIADYAKAIAGRT